MVPLQLYKDDLFWDVYTDDLQWKEYQIGWSGTEKYYQQVHIAWLYISK